MGNTQATETAQADIVEVRFFTEGHHAENARAADIEDDLSGRGRRKIVRCDRAWTGLFPRHGDVRKVRVVRDTKPEDPRYGTLFVVPLPEAKVSTEEALPILKKIFVEHGLQPKEHRTEKLRVDLPGIHGEFCHMTRRNPSLEIPELQHGWFFRRDEFARQTVFAIPIDVAPIPGVTVQDRASGHDTLAIQVTNWPAIRAALGEPNIMPTEYSCSASWSIGKRELVTSIKSADIGLLAPVISNLRSSGALIVCTAKAFDGRWTVNELDVAREETMVGELTSTAVLYKPAQLLDPTLRNKMLNILRASIRSPEEHLARSLHAILCRTEGMGYISKLLMWLFTASERFFTEPEELKNGLRKAESWIQSWIKHLYATPGYYTATKDPAIYADITPAHDHELILRLHAESADALARIESLFQEISRYVTKRNALRFAPEYAARMWTEYEKIESLYAQSEKRNRPIMKYEFERLQTALYSRLPDRAAAHSSGVRVLAGLADGLSDEALAAEPLLQVYKPSEI